MTVMIEKTADKKFLIESGSETFVYETLDEVITFIKKAFRVKEK